MLWAIIAQLFMHLRNLLLERPEPGFEFGQRLGLLENHIAQFVDCVLLERHAGFQLFDS